MTRQLHAPELACRAASNSDTVSGLAKIPIPVSEETLVISDNADIFGTVSDLRVRVLRPK